MLSLSPCREEMQDRSLVDNVDAKDSGFHGDEGDNKRKALKGLYFRIASKSKFGFLYLFFQGCTRGIWKFPG